MLIDSEHAVALLSIRPLDLVLAVEILLVADGAAEAHNDFGILAKLEAAFDEGVRQARAVGRRGATCYIRINVAG